MTPLPPKAPPILQLTTTETAPKDPQDAELLTNPAGFTVQQLDDPDAPAELLPIARSYATEKLSYEVLLFDQLNEPALRPIDGPLDLSTLEQPLGFSQPATGALLTFEQEWVPFGLSLGQLLHSLALAPGEHTHIAVIDWNRREQASRQEDTEQSESLSHEIIQRRSALRGSGAKFLLWNQGQIEDLSAYVDVGLLGNHTHKKGSFDQVIRRLRFLWDGPPKAPTSP